MSNIRLAALAILFAVTAIDPWVGAPCGLFLLMMAYCENKVTHDR